MYLKLLNSLRKIFEKFRRRVKGLLLYLHEYKVIAFCLTYILLQPLTITILRNINEAQTIGLFCCLLFIVLLTVIIKLKTRVGVEIFKQEKLGFFNNKRCMQLCTLLLFVNSAMLFQVIRFWSTITTERRIEENLNCFTQCSTVRELYITEEPTQKYSNQQVTINILQARGECEQKISNKEIGVILKVEKFQNIHIGQTCKSRGQLVEPRSSEDFNYKNFLKNKKIYFTMDYPLLECENNVKRSRVKNILTNLRIFLEEKIDSVLNEPQSSLLAGILFGSKRLLEKNFEEGVRIAGVSHIVSASGYNITVLSMSLSKVTSFLSKKKRIILSLIVIWLFAIFSGFSASIVRACIMSSLSFVAKLFGRDSSMHVALPLTAVIFLIMEPLIIFDAGFLLSLSAMIGLIYIQPILEKVLPTSSFVKENILSTMSCTISTLPISIFFFKTLSIWSVPANVLILPVVGSTMIFGILGLASAKFVSEISYFFFTIVNLQLKYFELIVMKIQSLGFGAFNIADQYALPLLFILLFVFIIVVIYFYPIKNEQYNYYLKKS